MRFPILKLKKKNKKNLVAGYKKKKRKKELLLKNIKLFDLLKNEIAKPFTH